MSEAQSVHSAAQSAVGYMYQARLALLEALRYAYRDSGIEIAVEKLDDVSFEKDGGALELLQTKHHLKKSGDLTDSSVDLWKTLRVWAETTKADPSLPGRTRFALVTTAQAPTGSAASYLRPAEAGSRDPVKAEAILLKAGGASKNTALAKAITAFTVLTPEMRSALVAAIEIIDRAPLIADMESSDRRATSHDRATWESGSRPRASRRLVVAAHLRGATGRNARNDIPSSKSSRSLTISATA